MTELDKITIEPKTKPATSSIIWLHGLGADANDFTPIVPELISYLNTKSIRFVFPNAPQRPVTSHNGMTLRAWFDIYSLNKLEKQDLQGLQATHELLKKIIMSEINAGIKPDKIILAGFSQGGAQSLYSFLTLDIKLAGIIALSTFLPNFTNADKYYDKTHQNSPAFVGHGIMDNVVPCALGNITESKLTALGLCVELKHYPIMHEVCTQEIQDISKWINNTL